MSFSKNGCPEVPSWPRITVSTSPVLEVQLQISKTVASVALTKVTLNCCPVEGLGNNEPLPVATVMLVCELEIADARVVFALFEKSWIVIANP